VMRSRLELALEALLMISMCSRPRKPQRKPKPRATELSGSKKKEESLSLKFFQSIAEQVCSCEIDRIDAGEDHGLDLSKPGRAAAAGRASSVMVSPTRVSETFLMVATEEADLAKRKLFDLDGLGGEDAHGLDVEDLVVPHEADLHAFAHAAVNDSRQ